jgi:2-amino-4-hydroxy-6-hydroxymethyldihydropteridine diphosphokinase
MVVAYIALGSNLGDRLGFLQQAVSRLADVGTIDAASDVFETDPVGYLDQPAFLNAVIQLRTNLAPRELLSALQAIEAELGRERSFPNAPRTLDLDLLLYDDLTMRSDRLTVPHPRLHERAFVLVPLAQIAPDLTHPVRKQTIAAVLAELGDTSGVRPYKGGSLTDGRQSDCTNAGHQ